MTHEYGSARINMVENQVRANDVTDLPIQDAMRLVERDRFCLPGKSYLAYAESVVEYAPGWFLMAPRDVAKMLQALKPRPGERALCIAAPYAAAVLDDIGLDVTLITPPGSESQVREALSGTAVKIDSGDLRNIGVHEPFDVIISEGAVEEAPVAWQEAVGVGGRLGVVERMGPVGKARLYLRGEDGILARREVFDATPPVMPGFEAAPGFAF